MPTLQVKSRSHDGQGFVDKRRQPDALKRVAGFAKEPPAVGQLLGSSVHVWFSSSSNFVVTLGNIRSRWSL